MLNKLGSLSGVFGQKDLHRQREEDRARHGAQRGERHGRDLGEGELAADRERGEEHLNGEEREEGAPPLALCNPGGAHALRRGAGSP